MRKTSPLFVLMVAVALVATPALAGRASVDISASLVTLDAGKAQLRITGPGDFVLERNLDGAFSLGLVDKAGHPLADGVYSWELRPTAPPTKRGGVASAPLAAESGYFSVRNGAFVVPVTGPRQDVPTKDQVIPDDLIVQGSACVGLDCVNNENFGFDTIRLKENNLRIHFDDTSTQAGFPANDWRLVANDSASGGSSKFSIEDSTSSKTPFTITAGAATNSIFADSTGRIGLRTSTPVLDLHINTSNTPAIRLEQNNSGGFTAQTWDIGANEANFFVRDVTGGSKLSFRIRPGAPTSSVDISSDGDVGIGTGAPDNKLHVFVATAGDGILIDGDGVSSDVAVNMTMQGDSAGFILNDLGGAASQKATQQFTNGNQWRLRGLDDALTGQTVTGLTLDLADGDFAIGCSSNLAFDLTIGSTANCNTAPGSNINAGSTAFSATSSRTLKENLTPIRVEGILDRIAGVGVYNYDFIAGPKDLIGLMAEDFHQIFGHGSDQLLNGQEVDMALWLAVQELTARNKELANQVSTIDALQARLASLEAALATAQK